ncbi:MAG: hypothetical protein ACI4MS_05305 [Candidatus Coproplasma sp.]
MVIIILNIQTLQSLKRQLPYSLGKPSGLVAQDFGIATRQGKLRFNAFIKIKGILCFVASPLPTKSFQRKSFAGALFFNHLGLWDCHTPPTAPFAMTAYRTQAVRSHSPTKSLWKDASSSRRVSTADGSLLKS